MTVIITTTGKKVKTISGTLLQDCGTHVKVIVTDNAGVRSIKNFKKETHVIRYV